MIGGVSGNNPTAKSKTLHATGPTNFRLPLPSELKVFGAENRPDIINGKPSNVFGWTKVLKGRKVFFKMSKKKWFILAAVLAVAFVGAALVLALVVGFFFGHEESAVTGTGLPVYTLDQTASSHAGYRRTTLTSGNDVFVSDYEEAALQLVTHEPKPAIGRYSIGSGYVCAIPGQPTTSYIAGDCGSEMPAYEPFRNIKQPPFVWRTATFREMNFLSPGGRSNWRQSTNTALIAELMRVLRDNSPVELPAFPFTGTNGNLATINLTCDQLPGLLFCPSVYFDGNGTFYLAESMTVDWTPKPAEVRARWIPASPLLTEWLKGQ